MRSAKIQENTGKQPEASADAARHTAREQAREDSRQMNEHLAPVIKRSGNRLKHVVLDGTAMIRDSSSQDSSGVSVDKS